MNNIKNTFDYLKTKHKFHLVDPSPWPLLASLGAFMLTTGGVLYMHKVLGGWDLFINGLLLILFVMYVWWRDVVREATYEEQHSFVVQRGLRLGMVLFIASEVMFFFAFFWAFFHSSLAPAFNIGGVWPPRAIISMNTYNKAQIILKTRSHVPHKASNNIANPLAGLIECANCGSSMTYKTFSKQPPHIYCYKRKECKNRSTRFSHVENRVISVLNQWLEQYELEWIESDQPNNESSTIELKVTTLNNLNQELKNLESQKGRLHDLLERGIYDEGTYLERSQHVANRINEVHTIIQRTTVDLSKEKERLKAKKDIIPRVKHVLEIYNQLDDPAQKNSLLKSVLEKCTYKKEEHQRNDQFTLVVYPKI